MQEACITRGMAWGFGVGEGSDLHGSTVFGPRGFWSFAEKPGRKPVAMRFLDWSLPGHLLAHSRVFAPTPYSGVNPQSDKVL